LKDDQQTMSKLQCADFKWFNRESLAYLNASLQSMHLSQVPCVDGGKMPQFMPGILGRWQHSRAPFNW